MRGVPATVKIRSQPVRLRLFSHIVLLIILSTGSVLLTLTSSLRDAEAIIIAGSLRMQSVRWVTICKAVARRLMRIVNFSSTRSTSPVPQNQRSVCAVW